MGKGKKEGSAQEAKGKRKPRLSRRDLFQVHALPCMSGLGGDEGGKKGSEL